jgi:hypothetical protein
LTIILKVPCERNSKKLRQIPTRTISAYEIGYPAGVILGLVSWQFARQTPNALTFARATEDQYRRRKYLNLLKWGVV